MCLMSRKLLWAGPLLLIAAGASISTSSAKERQSSENCEQQNASPARSIRRGVLGGLARGALGRFGGSAGSLATAYLPVGEILDEAISSLLDCREQQKAAGASQQVVEQAERNGTVGSTASWESESRPGVRGSSTVTAQDAAGCMTVTDVVIVDGEETRAPKRMCRRPPNNRYVRV
jgi:hypothetical protein